MKTYGKNLAIIKRDLAENLSKNVVSRKVVFAHISDDFYSFINMNSLTVPPEMAVNGFTNPSVKELPFLRLFRKNVTIESTYKGELIDFVDYEFISSNQINFLNGLTTEPG